MSDKKLSASELLRMACLYAIDNREELLAAYRNCENDPSWAEMLAEERSYLEQLRAYYEMRWGKKQ